jgi:hypothetical protein
VYDQLLQFTYTSYSPEYLPVLTALVQKGQVERVEALTTSGRISVTGLSREQFWSLIHTVDIYLNEHDPRSRMDSAVNTTMEHNQGVAMLRQLLTARPNSRVSLAGFTLSEDEKKALQAI